MVSSRVITKRRMIKSRERRICRVMRTAFFRIRMAEMSHVEAALRSSDGMTGKRKDAWIS